jgi:predicted MFS family arabinose efflux permease
LAPFAGGLAAAIDWRLAFVGTAVVAVIIVAFPPPDGDGPTAARPPIRPLLSRPLILLGVGAFSAAAGPIGVAVLVGLKTRDVLGMEPATAGLLLAGGNLGAMISGPGFGRLIDRYGARRCGVGATVAVSLLVVALSGTGSVATTAAVYAATGSLFGFVVAVLQKVGASIIPENRGGAVSAILAFRFAGHAAGPLLWVPVFARSAGWSFLGSAALGVITAAAMAVAVPGGPASTQTASAQTASAQTASGRVRAGRSGSEADTGDVGGVANTKNSMPAPASSASTVKPNR